MYSTRISALYQCFLYSFMIIKVPFNYRTVFDIFGLYRVLYSINTYAPSMYMYVVHTYVHVTVFTYVCTVFASERH